VLLSSNVARLIDVCVLTFKNKATEAKLPFMCVRL